jgi:hypothetical protein
MVIISLFITAALTNPVFSKNFTQFFGNVESTRGVILIISILAFGGVSYMLIRRIAGLRDKASIVFRFLTAIVAINTETDTFRTALQNIEKYLNDNDWILANNWLDRVQNEFTRRFLKNRMNLKNRSVFR